MKKISDVTYNSQKSKYTATKDRQVVHLNTLKPYSKNIHLEWANQPGTQTPPSRVAAPLTQPALVTSDIKLVDEYDVIFPTLGLGDTDHNPQTTLPTVQQKPPRHRHPPQCYGDAVYHSDMWTCLFDKETDIVI